MVLRSPQLSPFLTLDHFRICKGASFPDRPHRGKATVTHMFEGYHKQLIPRALGANIDASLTYPDLQIKQTSRPRRSYGNYRTW